MKVVLTRDVNTLGKKGQIVTVAEGYARNYLLPKGLAEPLTEGRMKEIKRNKDVQARKEDRLEQQARVLAAKLQGITVKAEVRAGEGGKLFGSVAGKDVAVALEKQFKINVDRKKLELKEQVKSVGTYKVVARLYPGVQAEFTLEVTGI